MSTTTHQTGSRVALLPISSSTLNAKLFTTSFSSNLKAIIDRTPQLKRSLTVEVGALQSLKKKNKKFCNQDRELILPSPVSTPEVVGNRGFYSPPSSSFNSKRYSQASMLKARLQMAYYKIKHQKIQVPSLELLDSFHFDFNAPLSLHQSQNNLVRSLYNVGTTPKMKKKTSNDLLASSTPIPVSIFKKSTSSTTATATAGRAASKKTSLKSVSFKTTTNTTSQQKLTKAALTGLRHPFLPQFNYTSSSPSKFVTSLPSLPNSNSDTSRHHQQNQHSIKRDDIQSKRTLKAPTISITKAVKLPSLHEITSNIDTSTPLPNKKSSCKSSSSLNVTNGGGVDTNKILEKENTNFLTPVKTKKKKNKNSPIHNDDSTQLMSSPLNISTTPSSMGAAKSLLQLAFDKK